MEETTNGILGSFEENIDERDFQIRGEEIPVLVKQDDIRYTRNQYIHKWSTSDCTIFANMYAACATCNYAATYDDFEELHKRSILAGRLEGNGRYMPKAAKLVRDYLQEKGFKMSFFRVQAHSQEFYQFSDYGYNFATIYRGNKAYGVDRYDNNVIDGVSFGPSTYGHAVGAGFYGKTGIVDSGSQPNKYELRDHKKLIENEVFGSWCYFFVEQKELEKTPEQYKLEADMRILEKAIGNTQRYILQNKDKLQGQQILDQIISLNAKVNPLNRNWLAYVLAP